MSILFAIVKVGVESHPPIMPRATRAQIQAEDRLRETTAMKALDLLTSPDIESSTVSHFAMFAGAFGATNPIDQINELYGENRPLRDSILLGMALVALARVVQE
jgi:hypothetical protein